jgi:TonB family protein
MRAHYFVAPAILYALLAGNPARAQEPVRDDLVRVSKPAPLEYPEVAQAARVQGVVVVEVTVSSGGLVESTRVLSGHSQLTGGVEANAKKWVFEPNGPPRVLLVYTFDLDGPMCGDAPRSTFKLRLRTLASVSACTSIITP